jgi:hypothetical protein
MQVQAVTLPQHLSKSFWWGTPKNIIDAARKTMGEITLDPASCERSNEIVKAAHIFSLEDNGFTQDWHGSVFLNPPGGKCDRDGMPSEDNSGQSATKAWWFKLAREWRLGHIEQAIFLGYSMEILQTTQVDTPSRDNGLLCPVPLDFPLCFPSRRLSFLNEENNPVSENTHASVIVFLPGKEDGLIRKFKKAFRDIGRCVG